MLVCSQSRCRPGERSWLLDMDHNSPEDYDDQLASETESVGDEAEVKQESPSATSSVPIGAGANAHSSISKSHLQKRRRVTRACDECRRKKIKCDGKQPCTHCTVYSYGIESHLWQRQPITKQLLRLHIRPAFESSQEPRTAICRESRAQSAPGRESSAHSDT